jgi:hypothetical protein
MSGDADLESHGSPVFWGEIAPCEHIAQFYEHDGVLLDTLAGFVGGASMLWLPGRRINIFLWSPKKLLVNSWLTSGRTINYLPISLPG